MKSPLHHTLKPNLKQQKSSNLIKTTSDLSSNNLYIIISSSDNIVSSSFTGLWQTHDRTLNLLPSGRLSSLRKLKRFQAKVRGSALPRPDCQGSVSPEKRSGTFNPDLAVKYTHRALTRSRTNTTAWTGDGLV